MKRIKDIKVKFKIVAQFFNAFRRKVKKKIDGLTMSGRIQRECRHLR